MNVERQTVRNFSFFSFFLIKRNLIAVAKSYIQGKRKDEKRLPDFLFVCFFGGEQLVQGLNRKMQYKGACNVRGILFKLIPVDNSLFKKK